MDVAGEEIQMQFNSTVACCDTKWGVPEALQLCGEDRQIACREMISFWTWESLTGININLVILAVNILVFWAFLISTEMNITKLLWIKVKEVFYGSRVSTENEVD